MIPEARALRDALSRVYRPWLLHLFETRGWEVGPDAAAAIDDGEREIEVGGPQTLSWIEVASYFCALAFVVAGAVPAAVA